MATSAATFQATWRIGRPVQENASPRRRGTVRARIGTGVAATIVVNLHGLGPANFRPAQLTPL